MRNKPINVTDTALQVSIAKATNFMIHATKPLLGAASVRLQPCTSVVVNRGRKVPFIAQFAVCDNEVMKKQIKRRLKTVLLLVLFALFAALLLLIIKFRSNTPNMALSSLVAALQSCDQVQIQHLSTAGGLSSLQAISSRYGQKQLGDYLASHKSARPHPHVFLHIIVFMFEETKTPPVTLFFKWIWNGWKLTSINGTPTLQQPQDNAPSQPSPTADNFR